MIVKGFKLSLIEREKKKNNPRLYKNNNPVPSYLSLFLLLL